MFDLSRLPETFEREHGCTEAEWLQQLPGAVGAHALELDAPAGRGCVAIGDGELQLHWQVLPPRQIALIRLPRLLVRYRFSGVDAEARNRFLRYFFLFMQKGGG